MNNRVLSTEMTATLRRLVQTTIFLLVSLHQPIIELGHWDWSVAFQASSIKHAHGSRDSSARSSDSLLFLSCMSAALCSGAMRRAMSHVATVSVAAMCSGAMKRALSHIATVSVPAEPNAGFAPACCDYRKDAMTMRGNPLSRLPQHPMASTQVGMVQQPPAYSSGFCVAPPARGAWHGPDDGLPTNVVPGGSFRLKGGGYVAFDDNEFTSTGPGEGSPAAMRPRSASAFDNTDYSRPFTTSAAERRSSTNAGLDHNAGGVGAFHGGAAAAAAIGQQDGHAPEERRSVTFAPSSRTNLGPSSRSPSTQHSPPRFESLSDLFLSLPPSLPPS